MCLNKNGSFYVWDTEIKCCDSDQTRQISLSSILKFQQEIGELQLTEINMDYEKMFSELGLIFVFTRINSVIYRRPKIGEKIHMITWCKGLKGIQYYRCYRFETQSGELLIDSMAAIATVDAKAHKLVKPQNIDAFSFFVFNEDIKTECPIPKKLSTADSFDFTAERTVMYSDTDYNSHLNNCVYANFMCDYMPGGMDDKIIKGFSINFQSEALLGETITVGVNGLENNATFSGNHDRGKCFEAVCFYKNCCKMS